MQRAALLLISLLLWAGHALAVPETVSMRVTDVTPSSFSVVWLTDVAAEPAVEVFADASMANALTDRLRLEPMPDAAAPVAESARAKGIMKVRICALQAGTAYWVRTVTRDPNSPASISYSSLRQVTTATTVVPYRREEDGTLSQAVNDLLAGKVYIRPGDASESPGLGDLLVLETDGSAYPVSAFVGEGVAAPEGVLDLNNVFDWDGRSLDLYGGERALLRIYRGGTLATLLHYRRFPADGGAGAVGEPVQGFFADLNLDGRVDETDFEIFKAHYRSVADDAGFNPDVNLIAVQEGRVVSEDTIDARDFARFATEYGNDNVE